MSEFEEKVLDMLKNIDEKLNKILNGEAKSAQPETKASAPAPKEADSSGKTVKPSAVVDKQKEEEQLEEKPPVEGRRVCADCGGTSFKEQEDRSKVLHQMGGIKIYAKRYICKSCGKEM
ncbi:MAG: hypothetical protein GF383_13065 [Candidatus Lokiarchaeota archaeon]|nr:hypothetical protein [Candidatus Lokiarchaeota archaeon]MBD3342048.1 hypothetical protein [Candidatus Lokiarchaeota archaeon]